MHGPWRDWIHRRAFFVAAFVTLAWVAPALARVGSGEHYVEEPASDHDSGSGDNFLVNLLVQLLINLVFRHPQVGIPLLIGVGVVFWYVKKKGASPEAQRSAALFKAENRTRVTGGDVDAWLAQLKAKDPTFELLAFLDRVREIFMRAQQGWFKRDLSALRPFVSDSNYQRLLTQQLLMSQQGIRDAISDVEVLDLRLVGLKVTPHFDTAQVMIKARLRDTDVPANASDAQALTLAKGRPLETFIEVWSFVRKGGALTRQGQDALAGKCPNCGAPFLCGAANQCDHCKAIVNSGLYDWTLAEITQGQEMRGPHGGINGIQAAVASDPGLCAEVLEDRASLCFWKWVEAQATTSPKPLSKVATPELVAATVGGGQSPRFFLECAVGAVNATDIQTAGEWSYAHFEILWSARFASSLDAARGAKAESTHQRWRFTLRRSATAKTGVSTGLSTSRCPQCSAPLSDNGAPDCEYCGQALASGERDWVLAQCAPY